MMKKNILLLFFLGFCITSLCFAQSLERSTISSAGTFYNSSGTQLSWTAAQPGLVKSFTNPSVLLTQGFQQGYFYTPITEIVPEQFTVKLYPNPSSGDFIFDLTSLHDGKIDLKLFDARGRLILSEGTFSTLNSMWFHRINLEYLPDGIYHCKFLFQSQNGKSSVLNLKLSVSK